MPYKTGGVPALTLRLHLAHCAPFTHINHNCRVPAHIKFVDSIVTTKDDIKAGIDGAACTALTDECGLATAANLAAVNATAQATAAQIALLYRAYTGTVGVTTECKGTWATNCTMVTTPATPLTPTTGTSGVCQPDPVAGRVSCQAVCPFGYIPIQNACTMPNANTPGKNVSNIENFIGFIDFGAGLSNLLLGSTYCTAAYKTDARVQGDYDYRIKSSKYFLEEGTHGQGTQHQRMTPRGDSFLDLVSCSRFVCDTQPSFARRRHSVLRTKKWSPSPKGHGTGMAATRRRRNVFCFGFRIMTLE